MAESIIQLDRSRCYICGARAQYGDPLDKHHVYFGPYRNKSEQYGLTVYIHHNKCHIFGNHSVHVDADVCRKLQADVQKIAMQEYRWTVDEFRAKFGRNYIKEE